MTDRLSVQRFPKHGVALVVLKDDNARYEVCKQLAGELARKNPDAILLVLSENADINCLTHAESMNLASRIADHLTVADLERIGLRRIVS